MSRRWIVAAVAAAALASALATPAVTPGTAAERPMIAAHRGGALLWPENSLLAFRNALALRVDFLETDVHLTADGEVVVLHDPTLDRTTTGRGAVAGARFADLADSRLKAADGSVTSERLPRLADVLDLLAPSSAQLLLEIKVGTGGAAYPGIEEKVLALVNARRLRDRVFVMAFQEATLARVRAIDPQMRTVLLVARGRLQGAGVASREAVRWTTAAGASVLGIDHRAIDADVVAAARAAGVKVATWTVNEQNDLRRVLGLGVDIVISDRPDLARRLAGLE